MVALVTGASSGIGRDIACWLSRMGYDLIITSRDKEKLMMLKMMLPTNVRVIKADLSKQDQVQKLYDACKGFDIDILVNNAGFGAVGKFDSIPLETERDMINLNIYAVHALTKLFLKDFKRKNRGHILNVGSTAGFYPGPLMSTYYATKSYVVRLSQAINTELREESSGVTISVLCPGPVDTGFNKRAGAENAFRPADSELVARYAVEQTLKGTFMIIPTLKMKAATAGMSMIPSGIQSRIIYKIQNKKLRK
ncbi:MAG: SDR family oxidoreductase [Oscillospiraceae bacterium]|nr:SDR family oxidoreductase [Oscillospiraceae bacterium]